MSCLSGTEGPLDDVLHMTEARQQPRSQSLSDAESVRTGSHRNMHGIHVPWQQTSAAIENGEHHPPTDRSADQNGDRYEAALGPHSSPQSLRHPPWQLVPARGGRRSPARRAPCV